MKKSINLIIIAAFLFSTMEIAIKNTHGAFNPIQLNFLRFLIGGLVLLPLAIKSLKKNDRKLNKSDFIWFLWTGFICIIVSMTFFTWAIITKGSSPAVVAIIFSCNPFFTMALASLIFKERITKGIALGLAICFIGIVFIINPSKINPTALPSMMLSLIAAFTFALYSISSKFMIVRKKLSGLTVTSFTFLVGSIELLIFIGISHISFVSNWLVANELSIFHSIPIIKGIALNNILLLLYISIIVSGISFGLLFIVMEKTNATMASLMFFVKPILAPILAFIIIGDTALFKINNLSGIILMLIGAFLIFSIQMKASNKAKIMARNKVKVSLNE